MSPALWFGAGFAACAIFVAVSVTIGFLIARAFGRDARQGYDPY